MIFDTSLRLPKNQYVADDPRTPTCLCLHYTAGYDVHGAFMTWANNLERVATPYIVGTDRVHEVHDPTAWAWHMGSKNTTFERRTLGIEIVNIGWLTRSGVWLYDGYGKRYCSIGEKSAYVELPQPWREQQYFATFPPEQVQLVCDLVVQLVNRFGIKREIFKEWFSCQPSAAANFNGILCHQNVITWKFDMGPAFPIDQVAKALGIEPPNMAIW